MEFRENPRVTTNRYFETDNSHFIVDTRSPFSRSTSARYKLAINEDNTSYNEDDMNIYENNPAYFPGPNDLVNEILRDYSINNHELLNGPHHQNPRYYGESLPHSFTPNVINTSYTPSCSNAVPESSNFNPNITFAKQCNDNINYPSNNNINTPKKCTEKTTYCRPVLNLYSQQFVQKTMQRNARLQKLVKKIVLARKREKQESWNNYINELKNKHGCDGPHPIRISTDNTLDEDDTPELIDDYYNARYICDTSDNCHNFLQDFYRLSNNIAPIIDYECDLKESNNILKQDYIRQFYNNDQYCYPMASQGRLMMLQKERNMQKNDFAYELRPRPHSRFYRNNTIIADTDDRHIKAKRRISETKAVSEPELETNLKPKVKTEPDKNPEIKHECLQTEGAYCCIRGHPPGVEIPGADLPDVDDTDTDTDTDTDVKEQKILRKKKKIVEDEGPELVCCLKKLQQSEAKQKQKQLTGIEGKLDKLIKSINAVVHDIKSRNIISRMSKSTSVCECISNNSNEVEDDAELLNADEQILYSMVRDGTRSAFTFSDNIDSRVRRDHLSKIDKILHEEMDKSNKIKRDIESILKLRNEAPCSLHITFDIPTRERFTEVTSSLSQAKLERKTTVEEIGPSAVPNNRMTIAVNTDPLGLLALLRVSTETVKQILSNMPQIDYYSYLSMLQFPQLSRNLVSHYICNICGAAFGRPSQLSDHIQEHNLGSTRDCCVCRHVLDMRHRRSGLYACQYCGQRFTRAYCCELHQQTCARRLGRSHDVASSLMILK